ncbi:hypothetical protein PZA11_003868 [Diplocarpon coronariae]
MFRLTSWISESRACDRLVDGPDRKMASHPLRQIVSGGGALKRRRRRSSVDVSDSGSESPPPVKRRRGASCADAAAAAVPVPTGRIRDAIESQLSLEILLKHQELRLINQELAKCQAALEQLRRCHLIPFPPSLENPLSMSSVSDGTGPAVAPGGRVPKWAPPFGVTDGPYARHYTKWLISDPSFDGRDADRSGGSRAGKTTLEGRPTRHSIPDGGTLASKSRSQRGFASQKLHALPSGYPPVKDKAGPCVLRRGDGQWVKLICLDCHRHDFSSTQGFINHCRISHRRDFKSHEEAAVAAGHEVEVDPAGRLVGEEKTPTPAPGVHPMVRSAPSDREAYSALVSRIQASLEMYDQGNLPGLGPVAGASSIPRRRIPPATPSAAFVPAAATPHLSELMRRRGYACNLREIVDAATAQVPLDDSEESDGGEERPPTQRGARAGSRSAGTARTHPCPRCARRPGRAAAGLPPRPASRLGPRAGSPARPRDVELEAEMPDGPPMTDLSPNTVASNSAPSLVSDDGDYDEVDDAESARSQTEDEDSDVAEISIDDDHVEKVMPRTVMRSRAGSGSAALRLRKEDKQVTFVSPVKDGRDPRVRPA